MMAQNLGGGMAPLFGQFMAMPNVPPPPIPGGLATPWIQFAVDPSQISQMATAGAFLEIVNRNLRISSLTLRRCHERVPYFFFWVTMIGATIASEQDLDQWVQDYVEQLWDHSAGLSAAQDTLAGVQHFMRNTIRLKGAWKLLGVWRRK